MNMRWNLNNIYPSFESTEYQNDLLKCDQLTYELQIWIDRNLDNYENAATKTAEYLLQISELINTTLCLVRYANLTLSVETRNQEAAKYLDIVQQKMVKVTPMPVKFKTWLGGLSNLDEIISNSEVLKEFEFFLKETKDQTQYILSENEEKLIAKMSQTGWSAWNKLHAQLNSHHLVDINLDEGNKKITLAAIRNLAYDKDSAIRKKAYNAEIASYKQSEDYAAACLNSIKGEVITVTEARGYNSVLDKVLLENRMKKESLSAMLEAIKESLPDFERYFLKKAKNLGHQNGLPFYDLFAPIGNLNQSFSYEEAHQFIVKQFATYSQKMADFADKAFKNNWLDVEQREGKRCGGFCSSIYKNGESRILLNFNSNYRNVLDLAHELGHAYHFECIKNENVLNTGNALSLAETASNFCETIVHNSFIESIKSEDKFTVLESSINDSSHNIVDIYSRYLFESELFEKRKNGPLSVIELNEMMISAQKKAYLNGLDHNFLHQFMWVNKMHYYNFSFYNFPYAFGLLFSKGLYVQYLKDGDKFVNKYDILLASTGKMSTEEVALTMGIDITKPDFWRSSLDLLRVDIDKFCEM